MKKTAKNFKSIQIWHKVDGVFSWTFHWKPAVHCWNFEDTTRRLKQQDFCRDVLRNILLFFTFDIETWVSIESSIELQMGTPPPYICRRSLKLFLLHKGHVLLNYNYNFRSLMHILAICLRYFFYKCKSNTTLPNLFISFHINPFSIYPRFTLFLRDRNIAIASWDGPFQDRARRALTIG